MSIWFHIVYNTFAKSNRFNDFRAAGDLKKISVEGSGLIMIGFHHGPGFLAWLMTQFGMDLSVLLASVNRIDLSKFPLRFILTEDYIFRGTYPGMVISKKSERAFVHAAYTRRPCLILMDGPAESNYLLVDFFGIQYPIGIFPFKLALNTQSPVVVVWLTKIRGKGYKLNWQLLPFTSVNEGITMYGILLNRIISEDPFRWSFALQFQHYRDCLK